MAADQQPQHEAGMSSTHLERQMKTRKRKGSLRKTALLGPGRSFSEKNYANAEARNIKSPSKSDKRLNESPLQHAGQTELANGPQQRQQNVVSNSSSGNLDPYISTTDEDESIPLVPGAFQRTMTSSLRASSESSGTGRKLLKELRDTVDPPSELMPAVSYANSSALLQQPAEWDYSATERWGWIILVTTWIVFVVGMGSCLGVWSWAWDVGETPYAPPELEDDPTLPIVGYYPALIVLTAVMAWVWVIVAWVGMKYFKHAKIQSDDT